ncbi:transcriptional regulator [Caulobacter sp. AP07]|uniref:TetR/AcrR family transcriptional regulator n=1 Tax=Caulobacter sp. AP07 TaxID=1144304 RepID=UPI0002720759|nr:TetR/AcrR family transcriptional regulator [Caulobacter sp. AP07]EJL25220.1 transcriptional regulator [Caulobacter sp. AP07]
MTQSLPSGPPRPRRPTRAAARWDSTHAGLIEAAIDLFRRFGAHATSIGDVVAAANLTKPTLYRHFPSKEALVIACLREDGRQARLALVEALEATPSEPRQRIRAIGDHFAAQFATAPSRGLFALNLAVEYSQPETPVHGAIHTEIERLQHQLALLIAPEASGGMPVVAHRLALVIFGASATCQALGALASEQLVESVEDIVAQFRE